MIDGDDFIVPLSLIPLIVYCDTFPMIEPAPWIELLRTIPSLMFPLDVQLPGIEPLRITPRDAR
jgi:hypothetical protein